MATPCRSYRAGEVLVRGQQSHAVVALASLRPNGHPFGEQLQQAIERTQREQEQARRIALAQHPQAIHAVIQAVDLLQAQHFGALLTQAGANVWQVQALPDQPLEMRVSYRVDWKLIEGISHALDEVRRTPGAHLQEESTTRHERTRAASMLEREREQEAKPDQSPGISW